MSHGVMGDLIDWFIVELRHDSNVSVSWQSHDSHRRRPPQPCASGAL